MNNWGQKTKEIENQTRLKSFQPEFHFDLQQLRPQYGREIWKGHFHPEGTSTVMFPSTLRRRNLKTQQLLVIFDFRGKLAKGNPTIIVTPSLSKSSVFKTFSVLTKTQSRRYSNSSGLKSIFEKLYFCDGQVWMVGAIEIKLCVLPPNNNF